MTIEEKAKAYDEALNWMRKLYPGLHGATKEDAEHYFPELRESEDERIRKEIIKFIQDFCNPCDPDCDKWIAYLEKQKEQKPAWSEEDEEIRDNIICILQKDVTYTPPTRPNSCTGSGNAFYTHQTEIDWLKSLRPQPQQNVSIGFMLYLDEHRPDGKMCLSNAECNEIETAFKNQSWDTILRYIEKYQPHWRPSNEQINYLGAAVIEMQRKHNESVNGFPRYRVLKELYEQLLKL